MSFPAQIQMGPHSQGQGCPLLAGTKISFTCLTKTEMVKCYYTTVGERNGDGDAFGSCDGVGVMKAVNNNNDPVIVLFGAEMAPEALALKLKCDTVCAGTAGQYTNACKAKALGYETYAAAKSTTVNAALAATHLASAAFAPLYGTYKVKPLNPLGTENIRVRFTENGGDSNCRMTGLVPRVGDKDGTVWGTTWAREGKTDTIVVEYGGEGNFVLQSGAEGNVAGWSGFETNSGNKTMRHDLVTRSALNAMRVRTMTIGKWQLVAAHRLNYNYDASNWHQGFIDEDKNATKFSNVKARGFATGDLYSAMGLVWLLLWRKDAEHAVCSAYMDPHFADLLRGYMPNDYTHCTATRWQKDATAFEEWGQALPKTNNDSSYTPIATQAMGERTEWMADKIRMPFFKKAGLVYKPVDALELAAVKIPSLRQLVNDMLFAYFGQAVHYKDAAVDTPGDTVAAAAAAAKTDAPKTDAPEKNVLKAIGDWFLGSTPIFKAPIPNLGFVLLGVLLLAIIVAALVSARPRAQPTIVMAK